MKDNERIAGFTFPAPESLQVNQRCHNHHQHMGRAAFAATHLMTWASTKQHLRRKGEHAGYQALSPAVTER